MNVDWNAEVVDQVESHWRHRLRPRMDGLSDEEYFWQPVPDCWTLSRRGTSTAPLSFGGGEFTWDYGEPGEVEPVTTIASSSTMPRRGRPWRLVERRPGVGRLRRRRARCAAAWTCPDLPAHGDK